MRRTESEFVLNAKLRKSEQENEEEEEEEREGGRLKYLSSHCLRSVLRL